MKYMFYGSGYNVGLWEIGDISKWNTGKVTDFSWMFYRAGYKTNKFELDLSSWNTSSVEDMGSMFSYTGHDAETFKLNLSGWNTSNVVSMSNMFADAGFGAVTWDIGDISRWNTTKVEDMSGVFYGSGYYATNFELDLSGWDTSSVENMSAMFADCRKLQKITLGEKFSFLGNGTITTTDQYLPAPSSTYIAGATGKWYNTSGEEFEPNEIPNNVADTYTATPYAIMMSGPEFYNTYKNTNLGNVIFTRGLITDTEFMFFGDVSAAQDMSVVAYMQAKTNPHDNATVFNMIITTPDEREIYLNPDSSTMFKDQFYLSGISFDNVNTSFVTNMESMFETTGGGMMIFWISGLERFNTSKVTNMKRMFYDVGTHAFWNDEANTSELSSVDLSGWDTSKVTDMSYMFYSAGSGTFGEWPVGTSIQNWNTSNVTNMEYMFYDIGEQAVFDVSNWNVSKVTSYSNFTNLSTINLPNFSK